jgi:hypothetical protein
LEPSEKIDSLIILDRRIDMVTPLLTQLTYEGLIDELIGLKHCNFLHPSNIHHLTSVFSPRPIASISSDSPTQWSSKSCRFPTSSECTVAVSTILDEGEEEEASFDGLN